MRRDEELLNRARMELKAENNNKLEGIFSLPGFTCASHQLFALIGEKRVQERPQQQQRPPANFQKPWPSLKHKGQPKGKGKGEKRPRQHDPYEQREPPRKARYALISHAHT